MKFLLYFITKFKMNIYKFTDFFTIYIIKEIQNGH